MDSHTFRIGDKVKADHGTAIDPFDLTGVVESHHDWWVMVRMDKTKVLNPYMEGELKHAPAHMD